MGPLFASASICFFLAATGSFSASHRLSPAMWVGPLLVVERGLLIVVVSSAVSPGSSTRALGAAECRLSSHCTAGLAALHWQVDWWPLCHQGRPWKGWGRTLSRAQQFHWFKEKKTMAECPNGCLQETVVERKTLNREISRNAQRGFLESLVNTKLLRTQETPWVLWAGVAVNRNIPGSHARQGDTPCLTTQRGDTVELGTH